MMASLTLNLLRSRRQSLAHSSTMSILSSLATRSHMSHGDPSTTSTTLSPPAGPRPPLLIGLEAARATQNILRLLEASHGVYSGAKDTLATVWHREGQVWCWQNEGVDGGGGVWKATKAAFQNHSTTGSGAAATPSLLSLQLSDERTALVKIQTASSSSIRYLSLLRLEPEISQHYDDPTSSGSSSSHDHSHHHQQRPAHDGWLIVREVVCNNDIIAQKDNASSFAALLKTLQRYLAVEHGGGVEDRQRAEALLAPDAALVTIGTESHPPVQHPSITSSSPTPTPVSLWNAPAGQFHSIPRSVYLDSVASQTPHDMPECGVHDAIVSIDMTGNAAAAVVQVGNGARTTVFIDHLFLGRPNSRGGGSSSNKDEPCWTILSKTFAPRSWPAHVMD